jgi:phenylpyruvate tautomerase PptA (4-oxalocrotonate tautomerase family)
MAKEKQPKKKATKKAVTKPVKKVSTKKQKPPLGKPTLQEMGVDREQLVAEIKTMFQKMLGLDPEKIVVEVGQPKTVDVKKFLADQKAKERFILARSRFHKDQFLRDLMENYEKLVNLLVRGPQTHEDMETVHRIIKYFLSDVSEKMVEKLRFDQEFENAFDFLNEK